MLYYRYRRAYICPVRCDVFIICKAEDFMTNDTKYALEASLKKFLLKKPIDKITIRDLTDDCGISRMAFYYHFKDIYDLV